MPKDKWNHLHLDLLSVSRAFICNTTLVSATSSLQHQGSMSANAEPKQEETLFSLLKLYTAKENGCKEGKEGVKARANGRAVTWRKELWCLTIQLGVYSTFIWHHSLYSQLEFLWVLSLGISLLQGVAILLTLSCGYGTNNNNSWKHNGAQSCLYFHFECLSTAVRCA